MKQIRMLLSVLALYISTNAQQAPAGFAPGKIVDPVVCAADRTQSYAVYIPSKGDTKPMPVVFFFDSHGVGSLPLNHYKTLAEADGFILVGSNNSKNGNDWQVTEDIWRKLFADARQRLKIDDHRIYVCGFSGGAKVASYVAIQHPGVRGVIAGGAGLPDGVSAADFPFSFTALAGEGDMNLTDLTALSAELDKTRTRHRLITFDGKHDWAPAPVMDQAFAGLQLEAMHDGAAARDAAFIDRRMAADRSRVEAFIRADQLIRAVQACRVAISYFEGLTPGTAWFNDKAATLGKDPRFRQQQQARQALFSQEEKIKTEYMRQFEQGDLGYWQQTIKSLQTKAAMATPEKAMYQRLLAYLSLAFYSISNQSINAGRNEAARHFVDLYKLADATNSEAWYFSAVMDIREGHTPAAESDLLRAGVLGFRDKERLRRQPEFQRAFDAARFARIESKMPR
jgi:pimeloyl-ACP methyl ester carboxylesterase